MLEIYHPLRQNNEPLGTLYIRTEYDITGRLIDYLVILLGVMATSLAAAALIMGRLQRSVTDPILQVAQVARDVMAQRDFSLRAPKTSEDEVGELVDAFNGMLAEVAARTTALEQTNHHLSVEMTERHKAEEALKMAARKKDEFLATLAHELRNPLAPHPQRAPRSCAGAGRDNPVLACARWSIMDQAAAPSWCAWSTTCWTCLASPTGKLLLQPEHGGAGRRRWRVPSRLPKPLLETHGHRLSA
ncbi:MAG: HAMP domain-containing protein [Aquabacterium sp.]